MITHEGLAVFFALFLLVLFFFAVIVPIIKRNKPRKITQQLTTEQKAPVENPFNAPPAKTHMTIIIDCCEGCRSKFDPPRVAAGEYVADDVMQHFCTTGCYDRIIDLCLPFYYHKGRNASHDPTFQNYLLKRYSDDYPGLKQVVYKEVYKWNKKRKEETETVTNRLRERIRERYQRKAGLEVEPQSALDWSTITLSGSERINPPPDGGCRRGYCYACGLKIGSLRTSKNDPTLPRGDTYWFCSSFCYTRTLRAWVPFDYRYEIDDET